MRFPTKLTMCGPFAAIFIAAAATPHRTDASAPTRAATPTADVVAARSLLLVYAAADPTPRLLHASSLPVAWHVPAATSIAAGARQARLRLVDGNEATLVIVPCALPRGGAPVGTCRGPGADHDAAAAPAPAVAADGGGIDPSAVTSICAPDLDATRGLVLEAQHDGQWHTVARTGERDFAFALSAGNRSHADVTYVVAPAQGGGR